MLFTFTNYCSDCEKFLLSWYCFKWAWEGDASFFLKKSSQSSGALWFWWISNEEWSKFTVSSDFLSSMIAYYSISSYCIKFSSSIISWFFFLLNLLYLWGTSMVCPPIPNSWAVVFWTRACRDFFPNASPLLSALMLLIRFLSMVAILRLWVADSSTVFWSSFRSLTDKLCFGSYCSYECWANILGLWNWFSVIDFETFLVETTFIMFMSFSWYLSLNLTALEFLTGLSPPSEGWRLLFFDLDDLLFTEDFLFFVWIFCGPIEIFDSSKFLLLLWHACFRTS